MVLESPSNNNDIVSHQPDLAELQAELDHVQKSINNNSAINIEEIEAKITEIEHQAEQLTQSTDQKLRTGLEIHKLKNTVELQEIATHFNERLNVLQQKIKQPKQKSTTPITELNSDYTEQFVSPGLGREQSISIVEAQENGRFASFFKRLFEKFRKKRSSGSHNDTRTIA